MYSIEEFVRRLESDFSPCDRDLFEAELDCFLRTGVSFSTNELGFRRTPDGRVEILDNLDPGSDWMFTDAELREVLRRLIGRPT